MFPASVHYELHCKGSASTLILGNAKAAVLGMTSNGFTRGSDCSLFHLSAFQLARKSPHSYL
jgi:hypothetical protein